MEAKFQIHFGNGILKVWKVDSLKRQWRFQKNIDFVDERMK